MKKYTTDVSKATPEQIKEAALSTVPHTASMYWSFRIMVGCGIGALILFLLGTIFSLKNNVETKHWALKLMFLGLPLPWLACEFGWMVAEYGRQPWTIWEMLPTDLSVSALSVGDVLGAVLGFAILYTVMIIVEMWLMVRYARRGPSTLGTGRYFFERKA